MTEMTEAGGSYYAVIDIIGGGRGKGKGPQVMGCVGATPAKRLVERRAHSLVVQGLHCSKHPCSTHGYDFSSGAGHDGNDEA